MYELVKSFRPAYISNGVNLLEVLHKIPEGWRFNYLFNQIDETNILEIPIEIPWVLFSNVTETKAESVTITQYIYD